MSVDYKTKKEDYFTNVRIDLISLIPEKGKILEVGAGGGDTLVKIKELGLAEEVMGIELMEIPASNQKNVLIDKFVLGNIETMEELPFPPVYFDVIICGDVLEHLLDPWKAVQKIGSRLKQGGTLLISIPNFSDLYTMWKVFMKRDFAYTNEGVLDKTHLRFFCKKNLPGLLDPNQFAIQEITPSFKRNPAQKTRNSANKISLGILEEYLAVQYLIVAKKK